MGLSSSQARLLNLTSRMHQIEYNAARLEAMKLQMANESRQVYLEYQNALEQTKVQVKTLTTDGSVTYRDLNNYDDFLNAGFALVYKNFVFNVPTTLQGQVPPDAEWFFIGSDNNPYKKESDMPAGVRTTLHPPAQWKYLLQLLNIPESSNVNFETLLTNIINSGEVTIIQKDPETGSFPKATSTDTDTQLKHVELLTSVATNTGLQEVTDETNLRKAEAKYEADMKRIDLKDRKYDYDLAALDNERNAVKQEMETLKTVARDNVERTFKLFS